MNDLVNRLRKMAGIETSALFSQRETLNEAASRISQQDAELDRLRRELAEAKEFRVILEGHLAAAIDDYNEARKALEPFARVAEHDIGESEADSDFFMPMKTYNRAPLLTVGDFRNALALRAKAEETRT